MQPIKGYEQFESITDSGGSFRIDGLYPSSLYALKPWSDKWTSETTVRAVSAPQGETAVLPSAMVISRAYAKKGGALVIDIATGATRYSVSDNGVISDPRTGLDWLVGPDKDTDYKSAKQWVASISDVAGGNWRMPTRQELKSLYQKGVGKHNMDPAFKTTGGSVWAEPYNSSRAWIFDFDSGSDNGTAAHVYLRSYRVFVVRARQLPLPLPRPLSSQELQELEKCLQRSLQDKQVLLTCALLVAKSIGNEGKKASALAKIAGKYAEAGHFAQALETAKKIEGGYTEGGYTKARALADIADKYTDAGQSEKAAQTLSQAYEMAKAIEDPAKSFVLPSIAAIYAKTGQNEKSAQIISQSIVVATNSEDNVKTVILSEIAKSYAEVGQFAQALEVARTIKLLGNKQMALAEIAGKYAEAGQFSQALETARTIEGGYHKGSALAKIAGKYAEAGQFSQALETAKRIEHVFFKASALSEIAVKYAEIGQNGKADQVFLQALEAARARTEDNFFRTRALTQIAGKYTEAGQNEKAVQILSQALKTAKTVRDSSRGFVLFEIVEKYAEAGQFTQALETVKTIEGGDYKARALAEIAEKYAEAGQFTQALETVKTIEGGDYKARALAEIAEKYVEAGQFTLAFETVKTIEGGFYKARALTEIAGKYAEAGQERSHKGAKKHEVDQKRGENSATVENAVDHMIKISANSDDPLIPDQRDNIIQSFRDLFAKCPAKSTEYYACVMEVKSPDMLASHCQRVLIACNMDGSSGK